MRLHSLKSPSRQGIKYVFRFTARVNDSERGIEQIVEIGGLLQKLHTRILHTARNVLFLFVHVYLQNPCCLRIR